MNAPDFRALCAELASYLQGRKDNECGWPDEDPEQDLLDRARILLAAPEAVGVSDEEWDALVERLWDKYETVGYLGERFMYCSEFGTAMDLARKELSRFAHPAPVPVSERLPGVEDCLVQNTGPDGEPEWWCWFYRPGLEGTAEWRWNTTPRLSTWYGWQGVTHWRPYWALPLPTGAQP
jgi:hypothetical protein